MNSRWSTHASRVSRTALNGNVTRNISSALIRSRTAISKRSSKPPSCRRQTSSPCRITAWHRCTRKGFRTAILRAAGLLSVTSTGAVDPAKSATNAVTVGAAANIYINLQGREPTGIVPLEQYEDLQKQIEDAFKAVSDPVTNERVFEIILKKPREPKTSFAKHQISAAIRRRSGAAEKETFTFSARTPGMFWW